MDKHKEWCHQVDQEAAEHAKRLGAAKLIDKWWERLAKEKPLSGKESVELQNFLAALKQSVLRSQDIKYDL